MSNLASKDCPTLPTSLSQHLSLSIAEFVLCKIFKKKLQNGFILRQQIIGQFLIEKARAKRESLLIRKKWWPPWHHYLQILTSSKSINSSIKLKFFAYWFIWYIIHHNLPNLSIEIIKENCFSSICIMISACPVTCEVHRETSLSKCN